MTDIASLGINSYSYGTGSLDQYLARPGRGIPKLPAIEPIVEVLRIHNINRVNYSGSFVIRTYAKYKNRRVEIGRDAILSRYNLTGCANCQYNEEVESLVPISKTLFEKLKGHGKEKDIEFSVEIQTIDEKGQRHGKDLIGGKPKFDHRCCLAS